MEMNKDSGLETPPTSDVIERHYWKAVTFLVILILVGSGFWGVRRFAPAVFLGKPDLIAVPNEERPHSQTTETLASSKPELLNINTASTKELQTLPNIGPKMAQRIIDYRKQYGMFTNVDALQNVKGIGAKTLEKLRPFVDAK
jgi:comEA protein